MRADLLRLQMKIALLLLLGASAAIAQDAPAAQDDPEAAIAPTVPAWPDWMGALTTADASHVLAGVAERGRKLTLEGWTRDAYAVTEESPLCGTVRVEPGTRVEFVCAVVPRDPGAPPPAVVFRLRVVPSTPDANAEESDDDEEPLFSWELHAEQCGRWMCQILDLGGYAGQEVALTIDATTEAESHDGFSALVADPVVLSSPREPPWNVVLVSIDTLRADHLSCYGYPRRTSPNIDAIAADGVRFAWDISAAPWTTPSHMSMLTGLYPSGHHVNGSFDEQCNNGNEGTVYRTLDRSVPTLAEMLSAAGWRTHALTAGVCVEAWLGFDHGFDSFHVGPFKLAPEVPAEVDEFLVRHAPTPFFLFLHTYEVHEPYLDLERGRKWLSPYDSDALAQLLLARPAEEVAGDGAALEKAGLATAEAMTAFYDAGVETADAYVGFVVARLKERGLWERTLFVVTSDHGQEIADHDPGNFGEHGHTLYDEQLHVPLVMHVPDECARGVVVEGLVQSVDVTPTILDLVGVAPQTELQGVSLADLARNGGTSSREFALSEATASAQEWKSLRTRSHKLIVGFDLPTSERSGIPGSPAWLQLFAIADDPREREDLVDHAVDLVAKLRDRLLASFAAVTRPIGDETPGQVPSEELLERLRELGYAR